MDSSTFKMMLESQERAYKSALDTIVKQMNDQINKLESKVSDLTISLEFTQREVDDLKANAKEHEKERKDDKIKIEKLIQQVGSSNLKIKDLEEKVIYQEDYSRRKNLRISGLEEKREETWEQTSAAVTSLLETKLKMPGVVLERAHRVGAHRDYKPRTIVARFTRYSDRDAAIRRGSYLKGTNIFLNEDMSPASLAIKNAQMPLLKQARAEGKLAFFRHTKLIIREKTNEDAVGPRRRSTETTGAAGGNVTGGERGGSGHLLGAVGGLGAPSGAANTRGGMDPASDSAGARGGSTGPVTDAADGAARGVVHVEAAGVWTGSSNNTSPLSLTPQQPDGDSRLLSASPVPSSQHKVGKKSLRSSAKK